MGALSTFIELIINSVMGFPSGPLLMNLPASAGTWVRCLVREDPLEEEMATHSTILAWEIPWIEEPGVLQSMGSQRVKHDLVTKTAIALIQ